jgi:tetratricopeptide (TPR) repeat protein
MQVLVQKDVSGRWLNRFAVMILIAIIAVQLSAYFKPEEGVARERARAAAVEGMLKEQARGHSELKAKYTREKEEAKAKLEGLAGRINERERESERKLGELSAALEQQKQETNRQAAEHTRWLEKMAVQIAETKRDSAAAKDGAQPKHGMNFRLVIPAVRIPPLEGEGVVDENRLKQLGAQAERPIEAEHGDAVSFKNGEELYRAGNYRQAAEIYSDLIARFPESRTAYLRRGDCYASQRQFDKAIADFAAAIRLAPNDARAHLARSWAFLGKGETNRAMTDAEEALRLEPTLAEAHLIRSEILARRGQPEQAGAARAEAVAVLYRRGVDSVVKRDYAAGVADLERVIRQAPGDVDAHTWCARAHYLRSDFPNAVKDLTQVIALRPNDKQSYHDRGMAYFRIGDHPAAIADFDRAIELDPAYAEAYLNRGSVRLAVGDLVQAAQDFSMVLKLEPRSSAEAYRLRSVAYASMGWPMEAARDRRIAESLGK